MTSPPTVHVVFGWSIAYTLRRALQQLGRTEHVIGLPDLLSIGPIDPPDPAHRQAWAQSILRAEIPRDDSPSDPTDPWAEATAPSIAPVYWACRSAPAEHACFLAYADRMQHRPYDVIDATDLDVTTSDGVHSPAFLAQYREHDIIAANLFERRRPFSAGARHAAAQAWAALRRENAPFRIVRNGHLISAPLTHYDALLLEQATPNWEIAARLIGRAITHLATAPGWRGHANGDAVLFGRMLALAETGALDITGPGPDMRNYQIRRPAA